MFPEYNKRVWNPQSMGRTKTELLWQQEAETNCGLNTRKYSRMQKTIKY